MNALMQISAYRHHGGWAFDDAKVGLVAEPFVSGISQMIDILADLVGATDRILLTFSPTEFPGASCRLDWTREEFGGNWYRWQARAMDGWLCPALFYYFDKAPESIFIRASVAEHGVSV